MVVRWSASSAASASASARVLLFACVFGGLLSIAHGSTWCNGVRIPTRPYYSGLFSVIAPVDCDIVANPTRGTQPSVVVQWMPPFSPRWPSINWRLCWQLADATADDRCNPLDSLALTATYYWQLPTNFPIDTWVFVYVCDPSGIEQPPSVGSTRSCGRSGAFKVNAPPACNCIGPGGCYDNGDCRCNYYCNYDCNSDGSCKVKKGSNFGWVVFLVSAIVLGCIICYIRRRRAFAHSAAIAYVSATGMTSIGNGAGAGAGAAASGAAAGGVGVDMSAGGGKQRSGGYALVGASEGDAADGDADAAAAHRDEMKQLDSVLTAAGVSGADEPEPLPHHAATGAASTVSAH